MYFFRFITTKMVPKSDIIFAFGFFFYHYHLVFIDMRQHLMTVWKSAEYCEKLVTNTLPDDALLSATEIENPFAIAFFLPYIHRYWKYFSIMLYLFVVVAVVVLLRSMTGDEIAGVSQHIADDNCKWKMGLFEAAILRLLRPK